MDVGCPWSGLDVLKLTTATALRRHAKASLPQPNLVILQILATYTLCCSFFQEPKSLDAQSSPVEAGVRVPRREPVQQRAEGSLLRGRPI